jgi:aspartate-semialdehyde dehydrogenase
MIVALFGSTGLVGSRLIEALEKRTLEVETLRLFDSEEALGKVAHFRAKPVRIETPSAKAIEGCGLAILFADDDVSREWVPRLLETGARVIDHSSQARADRAVPLVVPRVNGEVLGSSRLAATPNCGSVLLATALAPLHRKFRLTRVVVTTLQAASGAGAAGLRELDDETRSRIFDDRVFKRKVFPRPLAGNLIPQIPQRDAYLDDGRTIEERDTEREIPRILGDASIGVSATCVRAPVRVGHGFSVHATFERAATREEALHCLEAGPGVAVVARNEEFLTPAESEGRGEVFVSRVRLDSAEPRSIHLWVCGDNLMRGTSLNALDIAELMVRG